MKKVGILFQGQGSQFVGMGKDLYSENEKFRKVIDKLDQSSNIDIKRIMFEGTDEEINNTKNLQVIMYAFEVALSEIVKEKLDVNTKVSVAGFSLGEYPALTFANVLKKEEGIKLVEERARLMNEAMPKGRCMMAAVIGNDKEALDEEIKNASLGFVAIANYNSPEQNVIAGEKEAVLNVITKLNESKKAKCIPLKVTGAFHTSLLDEASEKLSNYINEKDIKFETSEMYAKDTKIDGIKVYSNFTSNVYENDEKVIKETLKLQMARPVKWKDTIENMINDGVDTFIEIGAKKTLLSFNDKIVKKMDMTDVEKANINNYLVCDMTSLNEMLSNI